MRRRYRWASAAALVVALVAGCTGGATGGGVATAPVTIQVTDTAPVAWDSAAASSSAEVSGSTATSPPAGSAPVPPPDPVFQGITTAPDLVRSEPYLSDPQLLSATSTAPTALVGGWSTSPVSTRLRVWTLAPDASAWNPQDLPIDGNLVWVEAAAGDGMTVIAGLTTRQNRAVYVVFTSIDRVTWTPVAVPLIPEDGMRLSVAAVGSVAYLVVSRADAPGRVLRLDGRSVSETAYPVEAGDDQEESTAGHDDSLLVLARSGADGPWVARTSGDRGTTWASAPLADHLASVSGVVWNGSQYVATGWYRPGLDAASTAAVWTSPDGATWTPATVGSVDAGLSRDHFGGDDAGTWFGPPAVSGDAVAVMAMADHSVRSALFVPGADGSWSSTEVSTPGFDTDERAQVGFTAAQGAPGERPQVVVVTRAEHGVRTQIGISPGDVRSLPPLGQVEPRLEFSNLDASTGAVTAVARSVVTNVFGDETRRRQMTMRPFVVSGSSLVAAKWDPAGLGDRHVVLRKTDPTSGREVVLASGWKSDGFGVSGFVRDGPTSPWRMTTGFGQDDWEVVRRLVIAGGTWIAVGYAHRSPSRAAVWTSADGASWAPTAQLAELPDRSGLYDDCTTAGGDALLVGSYQDDAGVSHPLAWLARGGGWVRAEGFDDVVGSADSCFTAHETTTVVISAETSAGGADRYVSSDGVRFEVQAAAASSAAGGDSGGSAAPTPFTVPGDLSWYGSVAGGYAALVRVHTTDYWSWALWLSADGVVWRWVPVPAARPDGGTTIVIAGDDLTFAIVTDAGSELWQVTGTRAALGG